MHGGYQLIRSRIPNGINVDGFARQPDLGLISSFGIRVIGELSVQVARLRPEKNIARLLHAFAHVAKKMPVVLVIVGDGAERRMLEATVEDKRTR